MDGSLEEQRTNSAGGMGVCLPEDEELRGLLVFEVVPLLGGVVVHLHVFRDLGVKDYICGGQVGGLDAPGVAEREGPVAQWAAEGFPDAGRGGLVLIA